MSLLSILLLVFAALFVVWCFYDSWQDVKWWRAHNTPTRDRPYDWQRDGEAV